ncbi:MAG: hypothetical protein HC816_14490 [Leptolyngbyaceae cyanobacterium RM1_1_2]|nr:hypothetical protein [Leptolyngbyaceae cyanobacterium RM1_1_2]
MRSLKNSALNSAAPVPEAALYSESGTSSPVSDGDRERLQQFLSQWENPMARWLHDQPGEAAAHIDQIAKLRNLAAHADSYLYQWHYELLQRLVLGQASQTGLLQIIYGS